MKRFFITAAIVGAFFIAAPAFAITLTITPNTFSDPSTTSYEKGVCADASSTQQNDLYFYYGDGSYGNANMGENCADLPVSGFMGMSGNLDFEAQFGGQYDTYSYVFISENDATGFAVCDAGADYNTCLAAANQSDPDFSTGNFVYEAPAIPGYDDNGMPQPALIETQFTGWTSVWWDFVLAILGSLVLFAITNGVLFLSVFFVLRRLHLIH